PALHLQNHVHGLVSTRIRGKTGDNPDIVASSRWIAIEKLKNEPVGQTRLLDLPLAEMATSKELIKVKLVPSIFSYGFFELATSGELATRKALRRPALCGWLGRLICAAGNGATSSNSSRASLPWRGTRPR